MPPDSQTRNIVIKIDTSGASGLQDTSKQLGQLNTTTKGLASNMSTLTNIFKGLAVAFVASEIRSFISDVINTGVELKNMSQAVGVSVEDLAKIQVAAQLSGVPMDNLAVALRRLNVNIIDASNGNAVMAGSFKALGLSAADINPKFKSTVDVLLTMADKFTKLQDGAAKSALATKLFGRAGSDIIPLLNLGSAGIEQYSLHITTDFATASKEFTNNVQLMSIALRNLTLDGFGQILPVLNEAIEKWDTFGQQNIAIGEKTQYLAGITTFLAISLKTIVAILGEIGDTIYTLINGVFDTFIGVIKTLIAGIVELADRANDIREGDFKDAFQIDTSKTVDAFSNMYHTIEQDGDNFATRTKGRFLDVMNYSKDLEDNLEFGKPKIASTQTKTSIDTSDLDKKLAHEKELLAVLQAQGVEQQDLQQLELQRYKLTDVQYDNQKDQYQTQLNVAKATKDFNTTIPKESALAKQYAQQATLQEQAREQNRKDLDDQKRGIQGFSTGATEAFKTYLDAATDTAAQTKALFTDAFKHMEDGIVNFVKSGKFNFADFTTAIIDDIIRIQVRMALAGLIGSVTSLFTSPLGSGLNSSNADYHYTGNASGGVMTDRGPMALQKYSSGGIATSPQLAMFGEGRTPEAYVPLPNGKSIPVQMNGAGGGTSVMVNVNMATGTTTTKSDSSDAQKLGIAVSGAVRTEIMNQQRPGGLLYAKK